MTTEERIRKAAELRGKGYNCAQCVLMSLSDLTGVSEEQSAAISTGFGGGLSGMGEVCGVASAMAMAESLVNSHNPTDKGKVYADVRGLVKQFTDRNEGCIRCADLKRPPQRRSCNELIRDGVEIMSESMQRR